MKSRAVSMFPVFFLMAIALIVFYPVLSKWPPLQNLLTTKPKFGVPNTRVRVWVNTRSGLYYCSDSALFGKVGPGLSMTQGEALQQGYRPGGKQVCQ